MIAKNEEKFIGGALASVVDIVDEMIVVDTGSTDKTGVIAKGMGAEVFYFEWSDDFAAARNFALSKATGDWILQLDADEELHPKDKDALRKLASSADAGTSVTPISAYKLKVIDENILLDAIYLLRFFKRDSHIRYIGTIHEYPEIINGNKKLSEFTAPADIRIIHHGYAPSMIEEGNKRSRNFQILQKSLDEEPENLHYIYHMGQEMLLSGRLDQAVQYLYRAFHHKDAGTMAIIFRALPLTLINLGRATDALKVLHDAKNIFPIWREVDFLSAVAHLMNFELVEAESGFYSILHAGTVNLYENSQYTKQQVGVHKQTTGSIQHLPILTDLPATAGSTNILPNFYLYILAKMRGDKKQAEEFFHRAVPDLERNIGSIYFIFASMIPFFNENIVKDEVLLIVKNSPEEIKKQIDQLFKNIE